MLGVKDSGRAPMAWSIRPTLRGDLDPVRRRQMTSEGSARVRAWYEPARQCAESCAVCSVACLAWVCGDGRTTCWHCGHFAIVYRFRKPYLQKRLRSGRASQWKSPRLSARGRQGITVRTKWQSGKRDSATPVTVDQRETACSATAGSAGGKPTRPKP